MGVQHITWVMGLPGLNSGEHNVLFVLANSANDEDECWPAVAVIARRTGLSERQVRRVTKGLQKKGRLSVYERKMENGYNRSNVYKLLMVPTESQNISYATSFERARQLIRSQVSQKEFHTFYEPLRVLNLHKKTLTVLAVNIFVEQHILSPERKELLLNACREAGFDISEVLVDASGVSMLNDPAPGKPGRPNKIEKPAAPAANGSKPADELQRRLARKKK